MAGEVETDSNAVGDTGSGSGVEQTATPAATHVVSAETGHADESGAAGHATQQTEQINARVSQLEKQVRQMRKLFVNHSHTHEEETPPAAASPDVVQSNPETGAATPTIAEKPPEQTASHVQEKQEARSGYFRRAHRLKAKVRAK